MTSGTSYSINSNTTTDAGTPGANPAPLQDVVVDTNCVLDLWVFLDPGVEGLRQALHHGTARWLATPGMRDELARVLGYPAIAKRLRATGQAADEALAAFDRHAQRVAPAPGAAVRCRDPDDQPFIDLAVQRRALLLSKDACVLGLARPLKTLGVTVQRQWPAVPRSTPDQ